MKELFVVALALTLSATGAWADPQENLLRTFTGHSDRVTSVAFAPDGRTALSGSFDKTLKLWDVAIGEALRTFTGHSKDVYSVAFAPDGRTALSGSRDKTLKLWDVATGEALRTFTGHSDNVISVAFAPDGRTALSGGMLDKTTLKLWDVATGEALRTFTGHSDATYSVAFAPDGRTALSGGYDKTLKLWQVGSPAARARPKDAQRSGAAARAALTEPTSEGFDGRWQLDDLRGTLEIKENEWRHPAMGRADLLKGRGPANYEVQYRHHRGVICDYHIKKTSDGQRLILEPTNPTQPVDFCPSGILPRVGS